MDEREKGTAHQIKLPTVVRDILATQPRIAANPHVFPGVGITPLPSQSLCKPQSDFAGEPLVAPIKTHVTPELANYVFHNARAEPAVRGWRDGRPA